jgi:alpha-tubulin suppressor-like RCC1 family protein
MKTRTLAGQALSSSASILIVVSLLVLCPSPQANATPRPPLQPPLPEMAPVLYRATFDEPFHAGVSNEAVVIPGYGTLRESWSAYSLERVGEVVPFIIPGVDEEGLTNLAGANGAIRLWVKPWWSSAPGPDGKGPGHVARLLELSVVGKEQSASVWSLSVSAEGTAISLVNSAEKESPVLLAANIAWPAGTWHQVVLNYGGNGKPATLFLDGELASEGEGVLSVPPGVAALTVASGIDGNESIEGEIEEVFCFARPLKLAFHYTPFRDIAALGPISETELAYRQELLAKLKVLKAQKAKEYEESGGAGMLRLVGPTSECVTNSWLYLTNVSAVFITNQNWTVTFEIQGTNGPADIFATTNLSDHLTNSYWVWLERGPTCALYEYTNQPNAGAFYILGTTNDTDADLLTDAYELLSSKTLVNDSDTDNDGMLDGWEVQNGLNPLDPADASDDPDGDWLTNWQEYNGGTNSTNPRDLMVVAWGNNADGQCNVPQDLRDVKAIAAGDDFSVALRNDGSVVAWGANDLGQTNVPPDLTNAMAISANFSHTIALRTSGTISMWGEWWYGASYFPLYQPSGLTNISLVAAGANHDLALRSSGPVTAWSTFVSTPYITIPTNVVSPKSLAAGYSHSVAVLSNGTVVAWGENRSGAPYYGWNVTDVPAGLSNVTSVAAGEYHTLALKADGTVAAWGAGTTNDPYSFLTAQAGQSIVPTGLSNVVTIAASGYHSMALTKDGAVVAWGDMASPAFLQSNVIAIATGLGHGLALRSGRQTPLILKSPFGRPELPGTNVTFTALGLGLAEVHYQWQFNGTNIAGQTNATLTVNNITNSSVGGYTVVISTGAGSVTSSVATLSLIGPPVITNTIPSAPSTNWITNGVTTTFVMTVQATALETQRYPLRYQWYTNGVAISGATNLYYFFSPPWAPLWQTNPANADYTVKVSNPAGTNQSSAWTVRVISPIKEGSTVAWGDNGLGQIEYPELTNTLAVAAGEYHSVAVKEDGTLAQWGVYSMDGMVTDPVGAPPAYANLVAVAAGTKHNIALKADGTVVTWGLASAYANFVPTNLSGVKAVAAGWYHNVALLTNGTVAAWGYGNLGLGWTMTNVPPGLSNVTAIAAGGLHSLALKSDGTVVSWGYNDSGETNVPSGLSNVVAVAAGGRHSLALKADGTVTGWGFNNSGQCTPPTGLSNVMAIAAAWAHSAALKNDGTIVCWGDNSSGQTNVLANLPPVKLIAAGGNHTLAGVYSPLVQYPVDVSKDLLLIYNVSSTNSIVVKDYYLAHRPMVGAANVLGIGCTTNEIVSHQDFTNQILTPFRTWQASNPTKHPQYIILFPDLPTRIWGNVTNELTVSNSVAFAIHTNTFGINPFVTSINMGLDVYHGASALTNDCIAYINKLRDFGTNYSPGQLFISASKGRYGNTNYVVDDVRHQAFDGSFAVRNATNGLSSAGVSATNVFYRGDIEMCLATNASGDCINYNPEPHITNAVDVAAYICWGAHSTLENEYPINEAVKWSGNSSWWIIETIESLNGWRHPGQGNFTQWFSPNAFGGINYLNTPIGAVTHTDEPNLTGVNKSEIYFRLWASNRAFASCAWNSRSSINQRFQAVGDPFVTK